MEYTHEFTFCQEPYPRFRTISVVFTADGKGVLRGGSDAKKARMFKLDKLPEEIPFDHRKIIADYISHI